MPVFISYSHQDKEFVDTLAGNLILAKNHVWVDRWEIKVGESLLDKVQQAIRDSSALIAVLSKSSIHSNWCSKELNAGLIRELDEKRVIVIPALIEDCEIPLFLRDKRYADFRTNYDEGLKEILRAIAKFTASNMGRIETPTWHSDWGLDWFEDQGHIILRLTIAEHGVGIPNSVLTEVFCKLNSTATARHQEYENSGLGNWGRYLILEYIRRTQGLREEKILLSGHETKKIFFELADPKLGFGVFVSATCRRLGEDTGMDVFYSLGEQIWQSVEQLKKTMAPRSWSEQEKALDLIFKRK